MSAVAAPLVADRCDASGVTVGNILACADWTTPTSPSRLPVKERATRTWALRAAKDPGSVWARKTALDRGHLPAAGAHRRGRQQVRSTVFAFRSGEQECWGHHGFQRRLRPTSICCIAQGHLPQIGQSWGRRPRGSCWKSAAQQQRIGPVCMMACATIAASLTCQQLARMACEGIPPEASWLRELPSCRGTAVQARQSAGLNPVNWTMGWWRH